MSARMSDIAVRALNRLNVYWMFDKATNTLSFERDGEVILALEATMMPVSRLWVAEVVKGDITKALGLTDLVDIRGIKCYCRYLAEANV